MLNNQSTSPPPPPTQHQQQQQSKIISIISKKSPSCSSNINIPQSMTIFNLKEISSKFKQIKTITNLKVDKPIVNNCSNNLTASSILNCIKKDANKLEQNEHLKQSISETKIQLFANSTTPSTTKNLPTQSPQLPYHYSDYENLYVCNLCHFTYDSLRSIKAHIWKHSGHSELSYPIIDNINNSKKTEQSISKPVVSTNTNSNTFSNTTTNMHSTTSGGICSVLLEVIEKLRDEETKTDTIKTDVANHSNSNTRKKLFLLRKRKTNEKFNCKKIIQKAKYKLRKKIGNNNNKRNERKKLLKKFKHNSSFSEIKECKIETNVLNNLFEDNTQINKDNVYELDTYYSTNSNSIASTSSPSSSSSSLSTDFNFKPTDNILNSDLFSFLSSLAHNDGHDEQYVCGLCSYVCYHLPSLKSHMWTHVKNVQFDYSINTSIINAALDYENKLNRKLSSFKKTTFQLNCENDTTKSMFMQRQVNSALELINYPAQQVNQLANYQANKNSPMVSFRCAKCGFESIDLSVLRLHKREHSK